MINYQIYLAGGMCNLTAEEQILWRNLISEDLHTYNNFNLNSKYNLNILKPTDFYNFENVEYKSQKEVMRFDLNLVRNSDLIIVNFNDPKSIGTAMELFCANELNIPIIGLNENNNELHPWLAECCTRICDSYAELMEHLEKFYLY